MLLSCHKHKCMCSLWFILVHWCMLFCRYNELYTVSCGKDQTIDNLRAELFESTEEGKVLKNHTENLNQQRSELNVYIQNSVSAVKQDFQKLRDKCSRILTEQCDEMSVMKKLLAETFLQAQTFSNTSRDEVIATIITGVMLNMMVVWP